jgi:predicted TIM-barrel fold metal-dependent hydrolase
VASVYVETEWDVDDEVGETRWVDALRTRHGLPTVAVMHARFERPDTDEVLAGHARFDFVRGVRQKPPAAPSPAAARRGAPGSMDDPRWRRGFAHLERHGFSYDLQTPWWHLADAADLARDFPRTTIVVNHTGLPADRSPDGLAAWRRALETVAAAPNVALKISGLGLSDQTWPVRQNAAVIRDAITIVGPSRCMFASNYPVDALCARYETIVSTFRVAVADRSPAEQRALWEGNALRIYRMA